MIDVLWKGRVVLMFAVDVEERGAEITNKTVWRPVPLPVSPLAAYCCRFFSSFKILLTSTEDTSRGQNPQSRRGPVQGRDPRTAEYTRHAGIGDNRQAPVQGGRIKAGTAPEATLRAVIGYAFRSPA
jgi:hypothetical protein